MSAQGITIVGASAGSGKTYRLTQEVTTAIDPSSPNRVALEGLVAVTFTRRAHAELAGRIRQKLVQNEAYDDAMRLPLAYIGTVHAACLRLLQEFALDAGVSPNVDVVSEDPTKLLQQALEGALPADLRERLDRLAESTELRIDPKVHRVDWLTPVFDIMELARSNRIAPDALPAMAERSATELLALLPTPVSDGAELDAELGRQLDLALDSLDRLNDGTKVTAKVIETVEKARRLQADGELPWSYWPKLAKLAPGKSCMSCVDGLRLAADRYAEHPRLHAQLRELTFAIYEAARVGLSAYAEWKERRRVVDYVDMLDRALSLLDHERVRNELARRLQLVVVDEFQDTSPIQLALFVRLHALAKRSVWVGDRKQCIFEYAGADPLLMDAVAEWVDRTGGKWDRLGGNYRSRTALVEACSELFVAALNRHGFRPDEVTVTAERDAKLAPESRAKLDALPPMGLFCLEAGNAREDAEAIAEGVRRILADPDATPVIDRTTKHARPVRPGDIAVLVATNAMAADVADALHLRGIRAAIARAGLLGTPEGRLTDAALRWLHDDGDSLAAATIDALTGYDGKSPDEWLERRIRAVRTGERNDEELSGWRRALAALRPSLDVLSPAEALDGVLDALDAVQMCARWPDAPQRIANLDALRALASEYEERCEQQRETATVAGLLRYFDDVREERLRRDEMIASDDQHVPTDDGAVVVCTYHKSKGLEWPVVVLAQLDRGERHHAFEVTPESNKEAFEPDKPLDGRWIRYWPWPFGSLDKVPLADAAARSDAGKRVAMREDKERARLLYVGFTRARDHLVLAVRVTKGKAKATWLDTLADSAGEPLLSLPVTAPDGDVAPVEIRKLDGSVLGVPARVFRCSAAATGSAAASNSEPRWFARPPAGITQRPRYRITPSGADADWPELTQAVATATVGTVERLPSAIVLDEKGYDYDVLGNAVHAFLAADVEELAPEDRIERARRLLSGVGLTGVVRPESLVRAGDQLRTWAEAKWPGAVWRREVPLDAIVPSPDGDRGVTGIIDLLLETPSGCIIVDHKTFPGTTEAAVRAKAKEFFPQMVAYATVLERYQSRTVRGLYLHLPVSGFVAEIVHDRPSRHHHS
jgi:ATP-dependent exoDNAse (exonuclease V) beta subunit